MTDDLGQSIANQAGTLLLVLVYLAGIVLALMFWKRYSGPSMLVLMSNVLLLGKLIAQSYVIQYLIESLNDSRDQQTAIMWTISAVGLVSTVMHAVGIGLLLTAVYIGRTDLRKDELR